MVQWLVLLMFLLTAPFAVASEAAEPAGEQSVLEVFVRDGCPHCADAKAFLPEFARERPGLLIVLRSVDDDVSAREDLSRLARDAGVQPSVPTFVSGGKIVVGFDSAERTGPVLAALVDQYSVSTDNIETALFGTLSISRLGLPLFTLSLGLLDGFNPCAMWVLLFLLSMLVHFNDRKRMALVAGTFVLVSGAVYYAFMAAWLNIFMLVGASKILYGLLGGVALVIGAINVKDFLSVGRDFTLSIPDAAKPGLYARMRSIMGARSLSPSLAGVAMLAVVVNGIELLCTAGFPAIYTAVLTQHDLSPSAYYAYLGLYILAYVADDTVMVAIAVIALSSRKLTERVGRVLKLLSGVVMLLLGGVMILRPEWLV